MTLSTFEEWKNCIENDWKVKLTKAFAQRRLAVYEDNNHPETRKFIGLFGEQHLNNIIYWFKKIL